jgi:paired amphipathic helix protein Sin3a
MMDSDASDDLASLQDDAEVSSVAGGSTRSGRNGRKCGGHASSGGGDLLREKLLKGEQASSRRGFSGDFEMSDSCSTGRGT